jgi:hypothetical protein
MEQIKEYSVNDRGEMNVNQETKNLYANIDLPDQKLDLFIKCVRQNNGKLSSKKT